jgi:hypothetical protein
VDFDFDRRIGGGVESESRARQNPWIGDCTL